MRAPEKGRSSRSGSVIVRVQKCSRRECDASSLLFETVELHSEYPPFHASSERRGDFGTQLSDLSEHRSKEDEQKREVGLRFDTVCLDGTAGETVSSRGLPPAALRIQPPRS